MKRVVRVVFLVMVTLAVAAPAGAGIVDKIHFFYAPKILGGDDGIPICRGSGPESMGESIAVHNLAISQVGPDVMLQGYLKPR